LIRTKNGTKPIESRQALLEFLTEASGKGGQVREDIELIAPVPFCLSAEPQSGSKTEGSPLDEREMSNGIAWTFSTFDLDRFGERIDPAGWDYRRYMENPVVEWAHRYDIPAIGKADGLCSDDKGLHGVVVFNDKDYDPFGWGIGQRVKAGVIRAGSVGFRVLEIEIPSKEEGKDGTTLIFRKQELLEFSICNVPANPWALAKPLALSKSIDRKEDRDTALNFWGNIITNLEGVKHGQ
jgi:HK97 family phage prohead protease